MRNMSFAMTDVQIRNRVKTVTRRLGWVDVYPGEKLRAVAKSQGLRKGEKVEVLAVVRVVSVRREPLADLNRQPYGEVEVVLEGFPFLKPHEFIYCFRRAYRCGEDAVVTRIAFEYVEEVAE